jgi:hypothetical protein
MFSESLTKTVRRMVEPNRRKIIGFTIFYGFKSGENEGRGMKSFVQSALRISP